MTGGAPPQGPGNPGGYPPGGYPPGGGYPPAPGQPGQTAQPAQPGYGQPPGYSGQGAQPGTPPYGSQPGQPGYGGPAYGQQPYGPGGAQPGYPPQQPGGAQPGYPPQQPGGGYPPAGGYAQPGQPGAYGAAPGFGGPPGGFTAMAPGTSPDAPFGIDPVSGIPFSDKQKMVAGLLQIFVGWAGAGRFYTGHTGIAVAQLLFGWATCGIWPLVDGILMLAGKVTDAQGRPLRDG